MPQRIDRKGLEALLVLVGFASCALSQTPPGVKQDAKDSTCSNIVALAGSVSINCSALTPAQRKAIEGIPAILNKIFSNQLDPDAVMAKLDEILHAVNPNASHTTYTLQGSKRVNSPGRFTLSGDAQNSFARLSRLRDERKWPELLQECQVLIVQRPEWFTPYMLAGVAEANLGHQDRALQFLEEAERGMADNPDYEEAPAEVKKLIQQIRSQP